MDRNDPQDGGTAFPTLMKAGDVALAEGGMSLRDYFAASALPGIIRILGSTYLSSGGGNGRMEKESRWLAVSAYALADAMLDERAKRIPAAGE